MKTILPLLGLLASLLLFTRCNNSNIASAVVKTSMSATDPFKASAPPLQHFSINAAQDNVVEGTGGTVAVFPKGCFKNSKGNVVTGNVKVELTEALTAADMVLANLTTTADGHPLVTGGMLWFNATLNGEQLTVDAANPVYFEVPTQQELPGMMAYKGTRDAQGNMNWSDPRPMQHFLVTVDQDLLDFLPANFMKAVETGMPYKNHRTATTQLADSLYYLMSVMDGRELVRGFISTHYNEPYYNMGASVEHGNYTRQSYRTDRNADTGTLDQVPDQMKIDPASIKVLKSARYAHTFIATREFETRLQAIFKTCDQRILDMYATHLDKNLYELDSTAVQMLEQEHTWDADHSIATFKAFAEQRLTNVKDAGRYAAALTGYYESRLKKEKDALEAGKQRMITALQQKNAAAQQLADNYCNLLYKREAHRMETYGFTWSETGWINIDNGTIPKTWAREPLNIKVSNGNTCDRVYTYILYQDMKSLYRLNTNDNVSFYGGNADDNTVLMPSGRPAVIVAVGYRGAAPFLTVQRILTNNENKYTLSLSATTVAGLRDTLKQYEQGYSDEDRLSNDIRNMTQFYKEERRQKALQKESQFFQLLWYVAYPCVITNSE